MNKLPSFFLLLAFLGLAVNANALTAPEPIVSSSYFDYVRVRYPAAYGAKSYVIRRSTTTNYFNSIEVGTTTSTSFKDKSADTNITYYYWVCPVDEDGDLWYNINRYMEGWRLNKKGNIVGAIPPEPTCTTDKTSYVQVSYSKVTGASSYHIRRSEDMYYNNSTFLAKDVTGTSYQDKSAVAGKTYYYWVTPVKDGTYWYDECKFAKGKRAKSSSKKLKVPQALCSVSYSSYIRIRYGSVSGAKKYNIYRLQEDSADDEWTNAQLTAFYKKAKKIGSTTGTSYKDKTAKQGKQYYYWVHPVDKNGKSYGDKKLFSYGWLRDEGELVPPMPTATTTNKSYVKVTWKKATGAKSYMLCRCDSLNIYSEDIEWIPLVENFTGTSYKDKTAKAGKTYYYWVQLVDKNGMYWWDDTRFDKGKRKK